MPSPTPPSPRAPSCRRGERGIALLIVLLLMLILAPFAEHFARQVQLEVRTARNVADQLAIENAIDGQFELVAARIEHDALGEDVDHLNDAMFTKEIQERQDKETNVSLSTRVFDEQGKFNVFNLVRVPAGERRVAMKERMIRILVAARENSKERIDDTQARELVEDAVAFLGGAKARGLVPKPNTPDNRAILLLEDLALSNPGWRKILVDQRDAEDVAPGLSRFLTVYGSGKVNLNTADKIVLRAYFPSDEGIADRIIERREGKAEDEDAPGSGGTGGSGGSRDDPDEDPDEGNPFTEVNQVNQIDGVDAVLLQKDKVDLGADFDVRSNVFSFRINAETQSTRREELYVLERVKSGATGAQQAVFEGFRHLLHQERTDALEDLSTK